MNGGVLVAVPTYRRATWAAELLTALGDQLTDVPEARVLLLDNDPERSAAGLAKHPLVVGGRAAHQHVGAGDVVSVRNAALDTALGMGAAYLVLIDDDELPLPGWLAELMAVRERFAADVVAGPVRQEPELLRHPHAAALLRRGERVAGPFAEDVGTGNVLVSTALVRAAGLRFDGRLGASGGEDTLFFRQAARAGARICWAPAAVVVERFDPARLGVARALRRSLANGRSSVVVERALGTPATLPRRVGVLVAATAVHGLFAAVEAVKGRREPAWRRLHKIARHVGRVLGPTTGGRYGGAGQGSTLGEKDADA